MAPPDSTHATPASSADLEQASKHYWSGLHKYVEASNGYFEKVAQVKGPESRPLEKPVGTSGPQGKVVPLTIIEDPADWKASSWKGHELEYTYAFTPSDIAELEAAVAKLEAAGVNTSEKIQQLTKADYDFPTLGAKIVELGKEVSFGRGFQLFSGFPVEKFDYLQIVLAYWGIAKHLGRTLVCQTDIRDPKDAWNEHETGDFYGSILNHVTQGGHVITSNQIAQVPLPFHADQGATDIISLLSVAKSREGGASRWVSSLAIHNELLRRGRKDLVEALSSPGWWSPAKIDQTRTLKDVNGDTVWENTTPFQYHDGYLSVYFTAYHGDTEERKQKGYELTPIQEEAYWAVVALANDPEFYLEKVLQPGEIEWLNNNIAFHSRSAIVNGENDSHIRHLVRWWVASDAAKQRPINPRYNTTNNVQPAGGFKIPEGSKVALPIHPPTRTKPSVAAAAT